MLRYSLRNQKKIADRLGDEFLKWLLLSLNDYFNKNVEPTEYKYGNEKCPIIHITNVQPHTDSTYELYIIKKTYNVYNLAYKSCMG